MSTRYACFSCGKVYKTKEKAEKCHDSPIQTIEDKVDPQVIKWWKGR